MSDTLSREDLPMVTVSEYEGVRYLHLDTPWVQGAMRLKAPDMVELEYVRRMLAGLLWRAVDEWGSGHAVQLGLGAATLTRFCHGRLGLRTTAVEINPAVIRAARQCFRLPPDGPLLTVLCEDAGRWVAQRSRQESIDFLHVDLYDHEAAAPVLDDAEFYGHCHQALRPGGVMTVNLFGRHASFERSAQALAQAFGWDQLWRVQATREGNTVVVAARGVQVPAREELIARADAVEARFGFGGRRWLRMVSPLQA